MTYIVIRNFLVIIGNHLWLAINLSVIISREFFPAPLSPPRRYYGLTIPQLAIGKISRYHRFFIAEQHLTRISFLRISITQYARQE